MLVRAVLEFVFVLLAAHAGTTTVLYGLTNGEHPKAYRAARFKITVAPRD